MNDEPKAPEPELAEAASPPAAPSPRPAGQPRPRKKKPRQDDIHHPAGTISSVIDDKVYVELGTGSRGVISRTEFDEEPVVGDRFRFSLVSLEEPNLWRLSRREDRAREAWKRLEKGQILEGSVIGTNTGGLELSTGLVSVFLPASEIERGRVHDLTRYVGRTLEFEVLEVSRKRKRVVVSRKSLLLRRQKEARDQVVESLEVGKAVKGRVEKIESFGAFVSLGRRVTGLLHVTNISHQRVRHPGDLLTVGQEVEVQVLEIRNGGKRIGLGMKQLLADPWDGVERRYRAGSLHRGKIVRIVDFGAFVELEPAVEGLLHRSRVSSERIDQVSDVLRVGEEVLVLVQSVDSRSRRIALSRLNDRGEVIHSEEDLLTTTGSGEESTPEGDETFGAEGTNLGALLRKAIEERERGDD